MKRLLRSHVALVTCWAILVLVLSRIIAGCAPVPSPSAVDNSLDDGGTARADCLNDGGAYIRATNDQGEHAWCSKWEGVRP